MARDHRARTAQNACGDNQIHVARWYRGTGVRIRQHKQDLSVHFVVGAKGDERDRNNPLIVAVSVQNLTTSGHWTGCRIDYSAQSTLKSLVRNTVRETARLLLESFAGWAGLDIIVDEEGKQWVVDLNPRFTGSIPLCLLSDHFFKQRGLKLSRS